jgi:hypothetical protein
MPNPAGTPQPRPHDVLGLVLGFLSLAAGTFFSGWTVIIALVGDACGIALVGLVFLSAERGPQRAAPIAAGIGAAACVIGLVLTLIHGQGGFGDVLTMVGGAIALIAFVSLLVRTRSWLRA